MNIDFVAVVNALKEINYDGYFTLEADRYLGDFTKDNIFDGLKNMAESAKRLAEMFEEK
jgi:sugar phosphate isomerase/epimerase